MADTLGNPDRWVRQALRLTHFLRKDTGGPLACEASCIKIGNRWLAGCGCTCKVEHIVHARELDFLVEDELVGRAVTMILFLQILGTLLMTYTGDISLPSVNPKDILIVVGLRRLLTL